MGIKWKSNAVFFIVACLLITIGVIGMGAFDRSGIIVLLIGLFLWRKSFRNYSGSKEELFLRGVYQSIPIDIGFLLVIICGLMVYIYTAYSYIDHYYVLNFLTGHSISTGFLFVFFIICLMAVQIQLFYYRLTIKNIRDELKRSISFRTYLALKEAFFSHKRVSVLVPLMMFSVALLPLNLLLFSGYSYNFFANAMTFIITILMLVIFTKRISYFNRIVRVISEIIKGNATPNLPVKGKSTLAELANNVNALKHGVKISLEQQAKSERLKTELITNVSHDLRTPLTSIISYTELLKRTGLTVEDRNKYIDVIDRKSMRLNMLIEDLFEASKMVSGNVELEKVEVDIVQLLQQALGEYEEEINQTSLQFRVNMPDETIPVIADGQKMWRVFDNLISNTLKYSLENTRVYITVKTDANDVVITFKNITKQELGENTDELLERFKRGDTSRHSEGSGLGLAIAKSIIDLHDGELDIGVDGDLFKISIRMKTII